MTTQPLEHETRSDGELTAGRTKAIHPLGPRPPQKSNTSVPSVVVGRVCVSFRSPEGSTGRQSSPVLALGQPNGWIPLPPPSPGLLGHPSLFPPREPPRGAASICRIYTARMPSRARRKRRLTLVVRKLFGGSGPVCRAYHSTLPRSLRRWPRQGRSLLALRSSARWWCCSPASQVYWWWLQDEKPSLEKPRKGEGGFQTGRCSA